MQSLIISAKNLFAAYFLCMLLLQFVAGEQYRSMIRMFFCLMLVALCLTPLIRISGKDGTLLQNYLSKSLMTGLEELQQDLGGMPEAEQKNYLEIYEDSLARQVQDALGDEGFRGVRCELTLKKDQTIDEITLRGSDESVRKQCQKWLCEIYDLKKEQVVIE